MLELNRIYQMDCLDLLNELDDSSVDLVLVDPPYYMGKKPFENKAKKYKRVVEDWDNQWVSELDYIDWLDSWVTLATLKLKLGGSILVTGTFHNIFDANIVLNRHFKFNNFITWFKPNAMPIMMAKKMGVYAYSCEYILYYSKGKPAFFDYDYLKELNDGKQHRDIFIVNNRPHSESVGHPTQKPLKLWRTLVQAHCPSGGLVTDFFAGSGVSAAAAIETGRNYILGEASEKYCNMAKLRIGEMMNDRIK